MSLLTSPFYLRGASLVVDNTTFQTRMSFSIEKYNGSGIGPGTQVTLYNLSKAHREHLEGRSAPRAMELRAGYGGRLLRIFSGAIYYVSTERHGPDILTTLQSISGLAAIQTAHIEENGIVDDLDYFNRCLTSFAKVGIGRGYVSDSAQNKLRSSAFSKPQAASGKTATILRALLDKHKLLYNIDFNVINVFDKDSILGAKVIQINKDTGMIGVPSKSNVNMIKVKSLLNPLIEPGVLLEVKSQFLTLPARMTAWKVVHTGDTLEGPWESDMEIQLPGSSPTLSADVQ